MIDSPPRSPSRSELTASALRAARDDVASHRTDSRPSARRKSPSSGSDIVAIGQHRQASSIYRTAGPRIDGQAIGADEIHTFNSPAHRAKQALSPATACWRVPPGPERATRPGLRRPTASGGARRDAAGGRLKLSPNHNSHSGYDEEDPEHDCRCHLKTRVQPVAHAWDGVDVGDPTVDPFMQPQIEPRERTPEENLQDAKHHHCHANGFHTSTIALAFPNIENPTASRDYDRTSWERSLSVDGRPASAPGITQTVRRREPLHPRGENEPRLT
jgi:hypothetical protein